MSRACIYLQQAGGRSLRCGCSGQLEPASVFRAKQTSMDIEAQALEGG